MTTFDVDAFLEHYGVKGMKWGVRNRSRRDERRRAKTFGGSKQKKPAASELDDKELQQIVQRMNMERQYNSLTRTPNVLDRVNTGTRVAGSILAVGATVNTAIAFSKSPAGQAIKRGLSRG